MCLFPSLPTLSGLEIILLNSLHCSFSLHLLVARSLAVLSFLFGWLIFGKNFGNEIEGFWNIDIVGNLLISATGFFWGCLQQISFVVVFLSKAYLLLRLWLVDLDFLRKRRRGLVGVPVWYMILIIFIQVQLHYPICKLTVLLFLE